MHMTEGSGVGGHRAGFEVGNLIVQAELLDDRLRPPQIGSGHAGKR